MTVESVDAALAEVRPYLQADGGDVEILGVQGGVVSLRLEGACRCARCRTLGRATGAPGTISLLRVRSGLGLERRLQPAKGPK